MIWRILKTVLKAVQVEITYREGDMLRVKLMYSGHVVFDKTIDIMPNV